MTRNTDRLHGRTTRRNALKAGTAAASGLALGGAMIGSAGASDAVTTRAFPIHHFVRAYGDEDLEPDSPVPDPQDRLVERAGPTPNPIDNGEEVYELDGRWIRWGEFSAVQGKAEIEAVAGGTDVDLQMTGLVPGGVYTMWVIVFDDPGFKDDRDLGVALQNLAGFGPLGEQDGSESVLDLKGSSARMQVTHPNGPLSVMGYEVEDSLLDEHEVHLAAAIHLDGETHGPTPGPIDEEAEELQQDYWAEQLGFAFGTGL